jgi:SrtB family sortase
LVKIKYLRESVKVIMVISLAICFSAGVYKVILIGTKQNIIVPSDIDKKVEKATIVKADESNKVITSLDAINPSVVNKIIEVKLKSSNSGVNEVNPEIEESKTKAFKKLDITLKETDSEIKVGEAASVIYDSPPPKRAIDIYISNFLKEYPIEKVNLRGLQIKNSNVIGWLKFPVLGIDEPIIIADRDDSNYYLTHDLNNEKDSEGCIELDVKSANNSIGVESNSILYGHNMANGNKFGNLKKLLNDDTQNKLYSDVILLMNSDDNGYLFKIVSIFIIDENDYFYNSANSNFYTDDGFWSRFSENIKNKNLAPKFNVDEIDSNGYLSLSTCYGLDDGQRLVVVAKKVG